MYLFQSIKMDYDDKHVKNNFNELWQKRIQNAN